MKRTWISFTKSHCLMQIFLGSMRKYMIRYCSVIMEKGDYICLNELKNVWRFLSQSAMYMGLFEPSQSRQTLNSERYAGVKMDLIIFDELDIGVKQNDWPF